MRLRDWLRAVFNGTVQVTWLCLSAIGTVASYFPRLSTRIPYFVRPLSWLSLGIGFCYANLVAYGGVIDRATKAERRLQGVIFLPDSAQAREELRHQNHIKEDGEYHYVLVNFALVVKNRDATMTSTVELCNCMIDISEKCELRSLMFDRLADERSPKFRDIAAGTTRRVAGRAVWQLPYSSALLRQTAVTVTLRLRDTRDLEQTVEFKRQLVKTKSPVQPEGITVRRNWVTDF